jgi:predicted nuclease of restriction endonuclease-like (RecB) superfamily
MKMAREGAETKDSLENSASYRDLLTDLKLRIRAAQTRAAFAVTRELVILYWSIGRDILSRQHAEGWGAKIIDRLARDLQNEFPGTEGFSPRNLKYMRSLADAWPESEIVPQLVALLPWGHLRVLLDRIKDRPTREWYLRAAVEYGWSRNILVHQIESRLHERQGKALTNFSRTLPPGDSDLAQQILKEEYNFDFLTLKESARERELERGLLLHLRDLLLELGRGFAFVGSQVPLTVDEQTFYLDLLFYHLRLHRYFVFELKLGAFKPEYAGKLGFYLSAIDGMMRTPVEGPSVGVLLCESRSGPIVEYALQSIVQPIGVSTYRVTRELPEGIQAEVPSIEELQGVVEKLRFELEEVREAQARTDKANSIARD